MTTNIHNLLHERGERYGAFADVSRVSQDLKATLYAELNYRGFGASQDVREALDMVCSKLARIVCGDTEYEDSWRDIAGYAVLIADRIHLSREEL